MNLLTLIDRLNEQRKLKGLPLLQCVMRCNSSDGGECHFNTCPLCGEGRDRFVVKPNKARSHHGKEFKGIGEFFCRRSLNGSCFYRDSQGKNRTTSGDSIAFARIFLRMSYAEAEKMVQSPDWQPETLSLLNQSSHAIAISHDNGSSQEIEGPVNRQLPPHSLWQRGMKKLLEEHTHISKSTLDYLEKRGLPLEACIRYGFAEITREQEKSSVHIGLPWLLSYTVYSGLLIPIFGVIPHGESEPYLMSIRKRDMSDQPTSRYVYLKGSASHYMNLVGRSWSLVGKRVLMITESDLDAFALHYAAGDLVAVVASGNANLSPSDIIKELGGCMTVFMCHDNDEPGQNMFKKWRELAYFDNESCLPVFKDFYPTPVPLRLGKDIGEAVANGLNLRDWVEALLQNVGVPQ